MNFSFTLPGTFCGHPQGANTSHAYPKICPSFPRAGWRSFFAFDLGKAEPGVPVIRIVLEEGLLFAQSLGQAQLVLDVLLAPALDDHVALLQLANQVPHHVHDPVFGALVHQVGLRQDACEPRPFA